ncbi:type I-C CRISPR-associated protein Cas8c/Csd1 [Betaproteobacteria bacterium]|nr:type I-C CRISPR-associated protein Cas8c/Csd1 [Betaproteobacteria bacterium]
MILQALYDYYQRKAADPDPSRRLPVFGMEEKEIPFIIELAADGCPLGITDTRQGEGKKKPGRRYLVPKGRKKTRGIAANLLWDTAEYALGIDTRNNPERAAKQHAAFRQMITDLPEMARLDDGIRALERFYADHKAVALEDDPVWSEILEQNPVVTFRLNGQLICQRPAILSDKKQEADEADDTTAFCLITGELAPVERLHSNIIGVWGAQSSGANIVSFNLDAFTSFNKEQGENAPVSQVAAFAYTTALNHLLARNSRQRIQVGDASTVFWAQKDDSEVESGFAAVFGEQDDPDARSEQIRALLSAVQSGKFDGGRGDALFYVLGLAPNAARISVRFWHAEPLYKIARHIRQWFDDLKIACASNDPEYPSLFRILTACAAQGKADNIPPNLGGDIMRAILSGTSFPATWMNAVIQRCRAEQKVTYLRAASIKACLNRLRQFRPNSSHDKELLPMLDLENKSPAYRLGRLFAALEKIQEEAQPGINATIRERYYGAASSTPISVFTTLLRLKNHHLAKLSKENSHRALFFERLIGEIVDGIGNEFPGHLTLAEQGHFAIGYYHQRQAFFTKSTSRQSSQSGEPIQEELK